MTLPLHTSDTNFTAQLVRHTSIVLFTMLLSVSAQADSWCDYDMGRIGTQAIRYVSVEPYVVGDPTTSKTCSVPTVTMPGGAPGKSMDCKKFQHMEHLQYTRALKLYLQQGHDPNDAKKLQTYHVQEDEDYYNMHNGGGYYTLMVFADEGEFMQLRLKNGTAVWTKRLDSSSGGYDTGHFPSDQIFSAPDRAASAPPSARPASAPSTKKIIALLASAGVSKKDALAIIGYFSLPDDQRPDPYGKPYNITADFVYVLKESITAADGTVWRKAEERFRWDAWFDKSEDKISKLPARRYIVDKTGLGNSGICWTEPLRMVYIPERDPQGKVLNVGRVGGLYCD